MSHKMVEISLHTELKDTTDQNGPFSSIFSKTTESALFWTQDNDHTASLLLLLDPPPAHSVVVSRHNLPTEADTTSILRILQAGKILFPVKTSVVHSLGFIWDTIFEEI